MAYIPATCTNEDCGGTGVIGEDICTTCFGSGSLPVTGFAPRVLRLLYTQETNMDDIITKLNALDAKMDVLDAHLDAIEEKIDAL